MKSIIILRPFILLAFLSILGFTSCTNSGNTEDQSGEESVFSMGDSANATLLQVGNELFAIPSPVQTAQLIKKSGAPYTKGLLNGANKAGSYSTKVQRGLNLGVYGADLGYVNLYEQTQDALSYLQASKKLADELGVTNAFSPDLIRRFEKNLGNKDSLLVMVGDAYRATDAYLKDNESNDVGSLILAGGWVEALYFATAAVADNPNKDVLKRIGEQKHSLEHLIKLLQKFSNNEEFATLVEQLTDLYTLFDSVEITYEFVNPKTDVKKKLTVINSISEVKLSNETLLAISKKIKEIRESIIS